MSWLFFLVNGVLAGFVTGWRPIWGIGLLLIALPSYVVRTSIGGLPTTLLEAVVIGFLVASAWRFRREIFNWRPRGILPWLVTLWLLAGATAVFISPDLRGALGAWRAFIVEPVLVGIAARAILRREKDMQPLVWGFGLLVVVQAVIAGFQWFDFLPIHPPWDDLTGPKGLRVTTTFGHPTMVGLLLAPIVTFLTVAAFRARDRAVKWLAIAGAAAGLMTILMSKTAGAILGLGLAFLLIGLFYPRTRRLALGACVIAVLLSFIAPAFVSRVWNFSTANGYTAATRRLQWQEAVTFLRDHPLEGAGLRGWPTAIRPYHKNGIEIFPHPHNIFFAFWVELGFGGLMMTLALLAFAFRIKNSSPLTLPAKAGLLTMLGHGLVDVPFFKNDLAILASILFVLAVTTPDLRGKIYNFQ